MISTPATVAACQELLLSRLKSGSYSISSNDKEGYRTLCCYYGTFVFVQVGDDGTSFLHIPTDTALINYLTTRFGGRPELEGDLYRWRYELTAAEQLQAWQDVLGRLKPITSSTRQFVESVLTQIRKIGESGENEKNSSTPR